MMVFLLVLSLRLAEVCEILKVHVGVGVRFLGLTFICCLVRVQFAWLDGGASRLATLGFMVVWIIG